MARFNFTKLAMRVHTWSGLLGGAIFVLMGLTGALLVFYEDLDALLFPRVFTVDARGTPRSLQGAVDAAHRALPRARIRGVLIPPEDRAVRVQAIPEQGGPLLTAIVDPYAREVRAVRTTGMGRTRFAENPVGWTYEFHHTLTAGRRGEVVIALAGLLLMLSTLTGTWVYRKQLLSAWTFRSPLRRRSRRSLFSSLHRMIGAWTLVLNLVLALSGFWMSRAALTSAGWAKPEGLAAPTGAEATSPHPLDAAVETVRRTLPGFVASRAALGWVKGEARFTITGAHPDSLSIWGRYGSTVLVDAETLKVREVLRPESLQGEARWDRLAFPVHQGQWGGLLTRLLYLLAGLGLPLMSLSGTLLWWWRTHRA